MMKENQTATVLSTPTAPSPYYNNHPYGRDDTLKLNPAGNACSPPKTVRKTMWYGSKGAELFFKEGSLVDFFWHNQKAIAWKYCRKIGTVHPNKECLNSIFSPPSMY